MAFFSHRVKNDITVIEIEGNITVTSSKQLSLYLSPFLKDKEILGIVINMKQSQYLDSSGLGIVVSADKALKKRKSKLVFCNLEPNFVKILQETGLSDLITIADTEDEAIKNILSSASWTPH